MRPLLHADRPPRRRDPGIRCRVLRQREAGTLVLSEVASGIRGDRQLASPAGSDRR